MKNSYSRKIMLSFIGVCLTIVLISGAAFFRMSKKMIADKHSLVVADYTNQTVSYVNRQMEKVQEIADLLMFDDWFKYILRQEYDEYGAYSAITNQILPKCQGVLKSYGSTISVTLYVNNHTLNRHYYESWKNVGIRYTEELDDDDTLSRMRAEEKYVLWTQSEQDKEQNTVSFYARLIDFRKMREDGVLIFKVEKDSLFPQAVSENSPLLLFEICGNGLEMSESAMQGKNMSEYIVQTTPLSTKGFELKSYISKEYYGPQVWESVKSILIVFFITLPFMILFGVMFKHLLYRDVDNILNGIKRVQSGKDTYIVNRGKNEEFRQIADVLNEYISSVEHLVSDVYEIEIQKQDIEFSMLQAKINPHFLYNLFTIMSEFAKAGFNEAVVRVLDKTAAFYRQILSKSTSDYTLREELDCVRAYMEIIDIIRPNEVSVNFETEDKCFDTYMPRFLLQPIVENSIKHAIHGSQLVITISAKEKDGMLVIRINDNGPGMTPEQLESCTRYKESGGYGIYNIISRLRLRYKDPRCGLKIESAEGQGTTAIFTIPFTTDYPEDEMYD